MPEIKLSTMNWSRCVGIVQKLEVNHISSIVRLSFVMTRLASGSRQLLLELEKKLKFPMEE